MSETRWHDHDCTSCGTVLGSGTATYQITIRRYEPMPDGPEWEAVGDWQEDRGNHVLRAVTLCGSCLEQVGSEIFDRHLARKRPVSRERRATS